MPITAANRVLAQFWDNTIPVNPIVIAQRLGVNVMKNPSMEYSGAYLIHEGVPTIVFNSSESMTRQRFTVAHELGHHCLMHGTSFRDTSYSFNRHNYDPHETEANNFATELLMPELAVRHESLRRTDLLLLSQAFDVSTVAMHIRLERLGIL